MSFLNGCDGTHLSTRGESDNQSAFRRTPPDSFPMIGWSSAATGGLAGSSKHNPFPLCGKVMEMRPICLERMCIIEWKMEEGRAAAPKWEVYNKKLHKHIKCEEFVD